MMVRSNNTIGDVDGGDENYSKTTIELDYCETIKTSSKKKTKIKDVEENIFKSIFYIYIYITCLSCRQGFYYVW